MVQIEEIQVLLDSYVERIQEVIQIFMNCFGHKNPTKLWRQGLIDRTGFLDEKKQIEYSLHGAGCTIEFPNEEIISFDFLEDETITFDLFKFENYVLGKIRNKESVIGFVKKMELYQEKGEWKIREKSICR
jgi:hypothetical protein